MYVSPLHSQIGHCQVVARRAGSRFLIYLDEDISSPSRQTKRVNAFYGNKVKARVGWIEE